MAKLEPVTEKTWRRRISTMLSRHACADIPTHAEYDMMSRLEQPIYDLIERIVKDEFRQIEET